MESARAYYQEIREMLDQRQNDKQEFHPIRLVSYSPDLEGNLLTLDIPYWFDIFRYNHYRATTAFKDLIKQGCILFAGDMIKEYLITQYQQVRIGSLPYQFMRGNFKIVIDLISDLCVFYPFLKG